MKDCKREAIVRAAEMEFMQKGFEGARMMEIAKRAGVGHPLLHYHFSTKEALFHHVVKEKMGLLSAAVQVSLDDSDKTLPEKLSSAISSHFDFVRTHVDYIRFAMREMEKHPALFETAKSEARVKLKGIVDKLQKELDAAAERGEMPAIDAELLLEDVIALNVFFHVAKPALKNIKNSAIDDSYYEKRKKENVDLILHRLGLPQGGYIPVKNIVK